MKYSYGEHVRGISVNFLIFRFFASEHVQLPSFPLRFLRCFERFGAENKTQWCYQYWLPGFGRAVPGEPKKGPEVKKILLQKWLDFRFDITILHYFLRWIRICSRILQLYTFSHRNNAHPDFRLHGEHNATISLHSLHVFRNACLP